METKQRKNKKTANTTSTKVVNSAKNAQLKDCENEEGCSAITFAQQRKILKEITDPKYKEFFYFCCCTGLRVCEVLTLKVKDVDFKKQLINIKLSDSQTKKHRRKIPFLPELFENLNLQHTYVFCDITDEGSKQYFYKLYKNLNYDLSRHSARHTFVSTCHYLKIDPECIQAWVGHTTLKMTTNTYTHPLQKGTSPILSYLRKLKAHHCK